MLAPALGYSLPVYFCWILSSTYNCCVERPHAFGLEWIVGLNFTPAVPNIFARRLGLDWQAAHPTFGVE
jgi:hypothetical protein